MLGLDLQLVTRLNIRETMPVKQASKNFKLELDVQIKKEKKKFLDVGFLKLIQLPTRQANIMPVKKKNCQIWYCISLPQQNVSKR